MKEWPHPIGEPTAGLIGNRSAAAFVSSGTPPGATSVADYVPAGWAQQPGFYRQVVKPYCASCHMAGPAHLSFSSWSNFQQNKAAIHTSVCKTRTMPHAEIAFREFWLKDTGVLFLPGLLAVKLGYSSCE